MVFSLNTAEAKTNLPKSCKSYYVKACKGKKKPLNCLLKIRNKIKSQSCKKALAKIYTSRKKLAAKSRLAVNQSSKSTIKKQPVTNSRNNANESIQSNLGIIILLIAFVSYLFFITIFMAILYGGFLRFNNQKFRTAFIPVYGMYKVLQMSGEKDKKIWTIWGTYLIVGALGAVDPVFNILTVIAFGGIMTLYHKISKGFDGGVGLTLAITFFPLFALLALKLKGREFNSKSNKKPTNSNPATLENFDEISPDLRKVG